VRDQERGGAAGHVDELVEEGGLGPNVQGCGRLVEDQDRGAVLEGEQRPGDGDALPLAAGQLRAVLVLAGEGSVEAARQALQRGQDAGPPGRLLGSSARSPPSSTAPKPMFSAAVSS
jgi:hypothetical protein